MLFFLILRVLLGGVAIIFILQNITPVTITFFNLELSGSLSVILLLTLLVGMLVSLLVLLPYTLKTEWQLSKLKKRNKKLEDDLMINTNPSPSRATEPTKVESENVVDL